MAENFDRPDIVERLKKSRDEEVAWYDRATENG